MDGDDYVMSVIRHRCGDEIADQVMPIEVLERVVEVLDAIGERMTDLGERAQALQEAHEGRLRAGPGRVMAWRRKAALDTLLTAFWAMPGSCGG
jgi:hypothetical protein